MNIEKFIRDVPDFPTPGIGFKDITPLLLDPVATKTCVESFIALLNDEKIDKVVGIEARGFFFGTLLASELDAGFVPVRKQGKLPFHTIKESYSLEYGNDHVEIHQDAIKKGERILVHDDVLATGGTAAAVCRLIEKLGGEVVQCSFLMELEFLRGKEKLAAYEVVSILKY